MKDLSLSLLSRGCGRLASSNRNTGRHDGRLDVCYTPQDLVTMETNPGLENGNRKKRIFRRNAQQMQQQLSTLKELTAAILSYSNNQYISSRLAPPFFPPIHLPPAPKLTGPTLPSIDATRAQHSSELLVQLSQQWLPAEKNAELEKQPEDKEEDQDNRTRVRLDLFLQIPRTSRTTTPHTEPQPWVHYVAMTPKEPEEPQTHTGSSLRRTGSSQHTEINDHSTDEQIHHPNMNSVHDEADEQGCFIQNSGISGDKNENHRSISGSRHATIGKLCRPEQQSNTESETNTTSGLRLPSQKGKHTFCHGPHWEKKDMPRSKSPSRHKHHAQQLPPIAETHNASLRQAIQAQTQRDVQTQAGVSFQSQENPAKLHQQSLFLPPLFPEREEEMKEKQRGGREKTDRHYFKRDSMGQGGGGGGRLPSEKGSVLQLEPDEVPPLPVGVLGCVAGRKGPGKQSSLAFLQNLQEPCESNGANRGVVRGVLPLELRDFQNGKSVGSLILGPDGEIIQLSLDSNSQDPSQGDGETQQKALQVLSAEGEELPWVIVLQPDHTNTEGGVELNNQSTLKNLFQGAERHMPVGEFAAEEQSFGTEQYLDLHRSTKTNAPSSHTDPVTATKKKRRSAEAVEETWKEPKKDVKNNVRMPPLRERVGKGELRGGNAEEEEDEEEEMEEEDEELGSKVRNGYLYGSHRPGPMLQNISPTESRRDNVGKRRKNTKRKDAEEAAMTAGKKDMKSADSDGQNSLKKKGKWQRQKPRSDDAQSIESETQEEQSNGEAAEALNQRALPSVKKKKKKKKENDREGGRAEVKMIEEREDQGEETIGRKEASAKRKRRRRLKHNELVVESPEDSTEKDDVESNPDVQKEPHGKSTRRPTTQKHSDNTTTEGDTDTDCVSTNDKYSSIQSVSSFRSTVASSHFNPRSSRRSVASSCDGAVPASAVGLASSRGRLSSCSTVMITQEQLMLNPVKPEFSRLTKSQEEEEAAALHRTQRAERRRLEVERKRREQEEEERKRQEREQTEERMKSELEGERRKKSEALRLRKLAEEEERRRREEQEQEQARLEQAQRERERRRHEEMRRQMERLRRMREEEEQRRKAELERLRLEQEKRQEEERKMLQEMSESERLEYLCRKEREEEDRRNKEEEQKRKEEEAAVEARLQTELLSRQMALFQQQLAFKRGLMLEAGGLQKTQGISRPWIYSYFALLQLLRLNSSKAETINP